MNDPVAQIKERLSIDGVISSYITLVPAGKNFKARCPFHNEKTPSFHISPERGAYYCFGCGVKGDIFTFVQEFEGLDFKGALGVLAGRAGVTLTPYKGEKKDQTDHLYEIMERATQFFETKFKENKIAGEYMQSRGVSSETLKEFRVGYAPDDWRTLFDYLMGLGFLKKDILLVGLIKEGNGNTYDRFRDRIMFPIFDTSLRVIAFSGRAQKSDEKTAKYLNSPETPLFQKSDVLYGLHIAKNTIRKAGYSIFVEGQIDLLLSHQAGFTNTVAVSGTALTDHDSASGKNGLNHFGIINRLSNTVIFAFDRDPAGLKAMYRATKICLSLGMETRTADIPEGNDPADIISGSGVDAWKRILKSAEHSIIFLTKYILSKNTEQRILAKHIQQKILPLIALLPSSMEQGSFVRDVSSLTNFPEDGIKTDLKKVIAGFESGSILGKGQVVEKQRIHKDSQIRSMIAGIYTLLEERGDLDFVEKQNKYVMNVVESFSREQRNALVFEIEEVYPDDDKKLHEDFKLYIKELEQMELKKTLAELEEKIQNGAGDETLRTYQELLKNISTNS